MKKIILSAVLSLSLMSGLYAKDDVNKTQTVSTKVEHVHHLNKHIKVYNCVFVAKRNIVLRDKPSRKGKIVKKLPKGSELTIEYCNRYGWCKVKGENLYTSKYGIKLLSHKKNKKAAK